MEGVDNIEAVEVAVEALAVEVAKVAEEPVEVADEVKDEPAPTVETKDEPEPVPVLPRVGRKLMNTRRDGYWRGDLDAEYCRIRCEATARNQRVKFLDTIHDVALEAANLARYGAQYAHDMPECARDDPKYFRDYLLEASGMLVKMAEMELERGEVIEIPEEPHVESL